MMIRVLLALLALAFCTQAEAQTQGAQETWICAYTWSSPDQTVIVTFQIDGDDLIAGSDNNIGGDFIPTKEKFGILQNNDLGIVAARSFAEIERNQLAIGAFVILIDKQNGKFQMSNAILGEPQAVTAPAASKVTEAIMDGFARCTSCGFSLGDAEQVTRKAVPRKHLPTLADLASRPLVERARRDRFCRFAGYCFY